MPLSRQGEGHRNPTSHPPGSGPSVNDVGYTLNPPNRTGMTDYIHSLNAALPPHIVPENPSIGGTGGPAGTGVAGGSAITTPALEPGAPPSTGQTPLPDASGISGLLPEPVGPDGTPTAPATPTSTPAPGSSTLTFDQILMNHGGNPTTGLDPLQPVKEYGNGPGNPSANNAAYYGSPPGLYWTASPPPPKK